MMAIIKVRVEKIAPGFESGIRRSRVFIHQCQRQRRRHPPAGPKRVVALINIRINIIVRFDAFFGALARSKMSQSCRVLFEFPAAFFCARRRFASRGKVRSRLPDCTGLNYVRSRRIFSAFYRGEKVGGVCPTQNVFGN